MIFKKAFKRKPEASKSDAVQLDAQKAIQNMEECQKNVLNWSLQAEMAKAQAVKEREALIF